MEWKYLFWSLLGQSVIEQFTALRNFSMETEEMINLKVDENDKWLEEQLLRLRDNKMKRDTAKSRANANSDKYFKQIQVLRDTVFISSVSIFESNFREICESQYEDHNERIEDFKSKTIIGTYKKYIEKIGVDLRSLSSHWNEIVLYYKVRNKAAHELSRFKNGIDKNLKEFLLESSWVNYNSRSGKFYIKDSRFTYRFTMLAQEFLVEVLNLTSKRNLEAGTKT